MPVIFHIAREVEWQGTSTDYVPQPFAIEGFIHCSTREQIVPTANNHFPGQNELVLLTIDCDRVNAKIVYENLLGGEQMFPHIYGKLNRDAVIAVTQFAPQDDGTFVFPSAADKQV